MRRYQFTQKVQKFIDAPFALGNKTKGWDCLNSIAEFYDSIGKKFPREFKGFNESNYAERWEKGEGREELRQFLLSLGESINLNYAVEGDLLVFEGAQMIFPGLYLGRGHVLMVFDKGARVVPLKFFKKFIIGVKRL